MGKSNFLQMVALSGAREAICPENCDETQGQEETQKRRVPIMNMEHNTRRQMRCWVAQATPGGRGTNEQVEHSI